jgi:hypothetical protein
MRVVDPHTPLGKLLLRSKWLSRERENVCQMQRSTIGCLGNLLAAAEAVSDDQRLLRCGADRRQQDALADVVVGKADATAHGGHLIEGLVRPTLEVVLTETPAHLRRRFDAQTGVALIDPRTSS